MRFRAQRQRRLLKVVGIGGVDVAQIRSRGSGLRLRRLVRKALGAPGLRIARAGIAGPVGVAERGVWEAEQVARWSAILAVGLDDLAQDRIAAARIAGEVEHVAVVGSD